LSPIIPPFNGFSPEAVKFLNDLNKNNTVEWFNKNRNRYEEYLVSPAKSFITEIGEFFNMLNPSIRTEPKFNQTIMRINKDMRFSKGAPYRDYFLIHFGRFKMDSEFYAFINTGGISLGMFLNKTTGDNLYFKENFERYPKEIKEVFKKYKLNGKYILSDLGKDIVEIKKSFSAEKDFDKIAPLKMLLLDKDLAKRNGIEYKPEFLGEAIKCFSQLYPLYCFAISPEPLRLIEEYEDQMGFIN